MIVILTLILWRPVKKAGRSPPFQDEVIYIERILRHGRLTLYGRLFLVGSAVIVLFVVTGQSLQSILLIALILLGFALLKATHDGMYDLFATVRTKYINLTDWLELGTRGERYRVWNIVSMEHLEARKLIARSTRTEYLRTLSQMKGPAARLERGTGIFDPSSAVLEYVGRYGGDNNRPWETWTREQLADHIHDELRNIAEREDPEIFAQRWSYWQHYRDFQTAERWLKRLFGGQYHLLVFLVAFLVFIGLSATLESITISLLIRAIFFGVSFVFALTAAGCATILFASGYWFGLEDLRIPLSSEFGDPIFKETGDIGLLVAVFAGIILGLGIPILFRDLPLLVTGGSIAAGVAIAIIFFTSVYGVHFSMENTKKRALEEAVSELKEQPPAAKDQGWRLTPVEKVREVRGMRVWPVNWHLMIELLFAGVIPSAFAALATLVLTA